MTETQTREIRTPADHAGEYRLHYYERISCAWRTRFFKTEEEAKLYAYEKNIDVRCGVDGLIYRVPSEEELKKEGCIYGFLGKHNRCSECGAEMMGRIKSYPPYCDSTYEEWSCPKCGMAWGSSA